MEIIGDQRDPLAAFELLSWQKSYVEKLKVLGLKGGYIAGLDPFMPLNENGKGESGFGRANRKKAAQEAYAQHMEEGFFEYVSYMKNYVQLHYYPERIAAWAKSVFVFALPVYQNLPEPPQDSKAYGRLARYSWGRDYHKVLGAKLKNMQGFLEDSFPGAQCKAWVDAHPIDEVFWAQEAGLGFRGRHSLCIVPDLGSWFALGIVLSSLDFDESSFNASLKIQLLTDGILSEKNYTLRQCPPSCSACLEACPSKAIQLENGQGFVDPRLCLSALTIEHKGSIPEELRKPMGSWIFGCDRCQEVCPLGRRVIETGEEDFLSHKTGPWIDLETLLGLKNQDDLIARYAGSPVIRAGWESLVRNACIVAANSKAYYLMDQLEYLGRSSPSALIRDHALWAYEDLKASKHATTNEA